jgi:hypothetical protein
MRHGFGVETFSGSIKGIFDGWFGGICRGLLRRYGMATFGALVLSRRGWVKDRFGWFCLQDEIQVTILRPKF